MDGAGHNYAGKLGLSGSTHRRLKSMDQNMFIAKRSSLLENSFLKHERNCAATTTCGSNIFTPRENTEIQESARTIQQTASKSPLSVRECSESGYKAVRDPSTQYQMSQSLSFLQFGRGNPQSQSNKKDEYAQSRVLETQFNRMQSYKFSKDQEAPCFGGEATSRSIILHESNFKEANLVSSGMEGLSQRQHSPDSQSVSCSAIPHQNHFLIPSKQQDPPHAPFEVEENSKYIGLYSQIALMMMEIKRLHWKLGSNSSENIPEGHEHISRQVYLDLEQKFHNILKKYSEASQQLDKSALDVASLTKDLKSREQELHHLTKHQEERVNTLFVDQTDILAKNRTLEAEKAKLEHKVLHLEGSVEEVVSLKNEIVRLNQVLSEKSAHTDKLRADNQVARQDTDLARGLVVAREQEITKLNQKNNELIKMAQEYSHVKQMLEIARKDVETYKEAYESREKHILKVEGELGRIEALLNTVAEKNSRIGFLEDEIKRIKEKLEEKDTQLEIFRSRGIDLDLERFKSAELANNLSQLRAKNEFIEQKIGIKEGEIGDLQKKLVEAGSKIQELQLLELKLEQVGSERQDLIRQIYELKQELLEIGRLKKQLENSEAQSAEKSHLLDKMKEKLEKSKLELKEAKEREDDLKNQSLSLQKELEELRDIRGRFSDLSKLFKDSKAEAVQLKLSLDEKESLIQSMDSILAKLRNELKETSEKHKTKTSMLSAENAALEERIKKLCDVEKKLEKSVGMNSEMKTNNDILQERVAILTQELKEAESNISKAIESNTCLENKVNILKEVEAKNKALLAELDGLHKELSESALHCKRLQQESSKVKEDLDKSRAKSAEDRAEAEKKEQTLLQRLHDLNLTAQELQSTLSSTQADSQDKKEQLEAEQRVSEDWRRKFLELESRFERYAQEYELMSCKFERMSAVNADHIKDIENKAFHIAQLNKKLLVLMIELTRVDYMRTAAQ